MNPVIVTGSKDNIGLTILPELDILFSFNHDKSEAYLAIEKYPKVFDAKLATVEIRKLILETFKFGIKKDIIAEQLAASIQKRRPIFGMVVAQGISPQSGTDSSLEYRVPRPTREFLIKSDGTIDFKTRDLFRSVSENEIVLVKHPAIAGTPGRNVFNEEIPPPPVKDIKICKGKSVVIADEPDGSTVVRSQEAGQVVFESGATSITVQVLPVLIIPGNVDYETGHIHFKGSVVINGSVLTGFSVVTTGNLTVNGVIERGAKVTAGGDLVVRKGILGSGGKDGENHEIRAFGNIHAQYAENARITAQGDIFLRSAMNCEISTNGSVQIENNLVGGSITAFKSVISYEIGNAAGAVTHINCGISHSIVGRLNLIVKILDDLKLQHQQLEKNLAFIHKANCPIPEEKKHLLEKEISKREESLTAQILKLELKKADLALLLLEENRASVSCRAAFSGVVISIRSSKYHVDKELKNVTFYQQLPEEIIVWKPYDR